MYFLPPIRLTAPRDEVRCAGNLPAPVHPYAVQAMAEVGIDISHQRSQRLDAFHGQTFAYTITVCDIKEIAPNT